MHSCKVPDNTNICDVCLHTWYDSGQCNDAQFSILCSIMSTTGCSSAAAPCTVSPLPTHLGILPNIPTFIWLLHHSFKRRYTRRFVSTEKAPTRAFSWLKVPNSTFTFKTLLRHYAKQALTQRSLNVKLGPRRNYHKGRAAIRHYANQTARPL